MAKMTHREGNMARWIGLRPAHNGVQVVGSKETANTTDIVYTVTAGKTLYLKSLVICLSGGSINILDKVLVRDAADVIQYYFLYAYVRAAGMMSVPYHFDQPLEIPAGWDIVNISAHPDSFINTHYMGWEE